MVIIKSDEKNRAQWKLGVVINLIIGRDGVVRGAKLRTPKSVIERPLQHLYPLELTCDMTMAPAALNPTVPAFRPRRNAAVAARARRNLLKRMIKTRESVFIFVHHGFHLSLCTDQVKIASKTFALSRQMGGEC